MNDVKSHIQVPRTVLKHFQYKVNGKVYYLDLINNKIHSKGIGNLGTVSGYFSNEMEEYLSGEIEKPLGDLINRILITIPKRGKSIYINLPDSDRTVKKYISALLYRSKLADDELVKTSLVAHLFPDQYRHDSSVKISTGLNDGILPEFNNYTFGILINHSSVHFVIPRNGVYTFPSKNYDCYAAPISPKCSLLLVPKEYPMKAPDGSSTRIGTITSNEDINGMNIEALKMEIVFKGSFVAADRREELQQLQKYREDNKVFLNEINY